jgi:16S rRNA (uracil1498-N3)-methyltransferase
MTRRRWIADEVVGNRAALTGAHAEHLSRVLRARIGQAFDITDGSTTRRGVVTSVSRDRVEFELGVEVPNGGSSQITLVLAIFKFDRMEWAIEKCTELGVGRIIPLIASRTDAHLAAVASRRVERWRRIAQQASEQARRAGPPEISPPMKLGELLQFRSAARVLLSESERALMLKDAVPPSTKEAIMAVGPEGGWTNAEFDLFRNAGWTSASLGETILRAETAAIAAVAIVLAEMKQRRLLT